jgi:hypothetical protein
MVTPAILATSLMVAMDLDPFIEFGLEIIRE